MNDSSTYSASDAAALMYAGKLTALRLAEDCLARIAEREREIGAWSYINPAQVLAQAKACDGESRRSPLHGIPIGVKDLIDTSDMPTEYGSPIYAGHRPRSDAACVTILRNAGAVIMGKTVLPEFALHYPGKTRNPHNTAHTPGGSSSGSAAAVADFMVPIAISTQGGGSTIRPAAYCGVVGFKPTFNAVNRMGTKPVGESLDTMGIMSRTLPDVKLAFSVLTSSTPDTLNIETPRVGFCRTAQWEYADSATHKALENAVSELRRAGANVKEVVLPEQFAGLLAAHACINDFELYRALSYERSHFPEKISENLMAAFERAARRTLPEYFAAQQLAADCRQMLKQVLAENDVLMLPSAPGEAPPGLNSTGDAIFNRIWTLLYTPAISVPVFTGPSNLPIGLQLVGPFGTDYRLLACADWVRHKLT